MIMNELVTELADLQAERSALEASADIASSGIDLMIVHAKNELAVLKDQRNELRQADEISMGAMDVEISTLKAHILEMWDGEKRTIRYEEGLLKMRTTKSLQIMDGAVLLENLMHHFATPRVATEFISGFNKTAVRKFVDLHPLPGVVDLISTTSVKLEAE